MKKLDFYFKPKDASSTKSFDTSQAGVSDSLPSPLDSQKPKASTHVGPPYPDIRILTEDELSKHETKVNLLKSEWEPNVYSQFTFPSRYIKLYKTLVYTINNLIKKKQGLNSLKNYYSLLSVGVLSHVFL
jgi:hypothetical protein